MELTGTVTEVLEKITGNSRNGKEWQKQLFVVTYTDGQYSKQVCFTAFGKAVDNVPMHGDNVTVSFNVESREFGGRWYTDVNAWKVKVNAQPERVAYDSSKQNPDNNLPF